MPADTLPPTAMTDTERLYQQRLKRYLTAMRHGKPDRVPIRPFVAEFICNHTGMTCQQVTQDYTKAFEATLQCAADYDWDATVANMVYVWGGLTQAAALRYYAIPGVGLAPTTGFNYLEPGEEQAFMRGDEYDALIEDPTGFLFNVWLPRISRDVVEPGKATTVEKAYRNNLALLKGGMAMLSYFGSFPAQIEKMRRQTGTVSAIAGILKAPMDIIADKLRGYLGLVDDLMNQPEKVLAACEALAPHLLHVAMTSADPNKQVPIGFWMHRGCVPFINREHFNEIFWPTLKPVIQELWRAGHQVLFYAEGKWAAHWNTFRELPEGSIVYQCDRDDIFECHKALGDRFCISGGVPNEMLAYGSPEQVRERVKNVIRTVGRNGGFILDAAAIVQNDATVENMKAMTEAGREYGEY